MRGLLLLVPVLLYLLPLLLYLNIIIIILLSLKWVLKSYTSWEVENSPLMIPLMKDPMIMTIITIMTIDFKGNFSLFITGGMRRLFRTENAKILFYLPQEKKKILFVQTGKEDMQEVSILFPCISDLMMMMMQTLVTS